MISQKEARERMEVSNNRSKKLLEIKTRMAQSFEGLIIGPKIRWHSAKGYACINVGPLNQKTIEALEKKGYSVFFTGRFYNITW